MTERPVHFALVVALVLAVVTGCGGKNGAKPTTMKSVTTTSRAVFNATLVAPNHHPVVNEGWPITVKVTNLSGKPIAARLQMIILFEGAKVGQVDDGKVYRITGRHHEIITWPEAAVGHQLTFQVVIKAKGMTKKLLWPVEVVKK